MKPLPCVAALLLVVGCGDDGNPGAPDAEPDAPPIDPACSPTPPALPTEGPFVDPYALPMTGECVVGGMREAPGRWFFRDENATFTFSYPKIEGDCTQGFVRGNDDPIDTDPTDDGYSYHVWSDGTRFMTRVYFRFPETGPPEFEYVFAFGACMLSDGTMAGVQAYFDTDAGEITSPQVGRRFVRAGAQVSEGLTLLGEIATASSGDSIAGLNVVVDDMHAYVVGFNGLDVIDISDPAAPTPVAHVDGDFNDIKIVRAGGRVVAYLAPLQSNTTRIVDVTIPTAPIEATAIDEYSHSVQIVPGSPPRLYLANYSDRIPVFDVSMPLAPVKLGEVPVPPPASDGVHDLTVDGDMIYANYTTVGMIALDVAGGLDNPIERGRIETSYSHASWAGTVGGGIPIILHGDEGMTIGDGGAFLRILDGDPASATFANEIGRFQTRPEVGIHNIQLVGDKVYLSYYQDGVRVVDVSNPAQPAQTAYFNTWDIDGSYGGRFEGTAGIRVHDGTIYAADLARGLLIFQEQ